MTQTTPRGTALPRRRHTPFLPPCLLRAGPSPTGRAAPQTLSEGVGHVHRPHEELGSTCYRNQNTKATQGPRVTKFLRLAWNCSWLPSASGRCSIAGQCHRPAHAGWDCMFAHLSLPACFWSGKNGFSELQVLLGDFILNPDPFYYYLNVTTPCRMLVP